MGLNWGFGDRQAGLRMVRCMGRCLGGGTWHGWLGGWWWCMEWCMDGWCVDDVGDVRGGGIN